MFFHFKSNIFHAKNTNSNKNFIYIFSLNGMPTLRLGGPRTKKIQALPIATTLCIQNRIRDNSLLKCYRTDITDNL